MCCVCKSHKILFSVYAFYYEYFSDTLSRIEIFLMHNFHFVSLHFWQNSTFLVVYANFHSINPSQKFCFIALFFWSHKLLILWHSNCFHINKLHNFYIIKCLIPLSFKKWSMIHDVNHSLWIFKSFSFCCCLVPPFFVNLATIIFGNILFKYCSYILDYIYIVST